MDEWMNECKWAAVYIVRCTYLKFELKISCTNQTSWTIFTWNAWTHTHISDACQACHSIRKINQRINVNEDIQLSVIVYSLHPPYKLDTIAGKDDVYAMPELKLIQNNCICAQITMFSMKDIYSLWFVHLYISNVDCCV